MVEPSTIITKFYEKLKSIPCMIVEAAIRMDKTQRYIIVEVGDGWRVPVPLPGWARWVAMNKSGSVYCFSDQPEPSTVAWWCDGYCDRLLAGVQDPERFDWKKCIVEVT